MAFKSKILGYYLSNYKKDADGFADTSLQNLVNGGHESKMPFLNKSRFEKFINEGTSMDEINSIDIKISERSHWPPAIRFLCQMYKNDELKTPPNKVLITSNRRTIVELIKVLSDKQGSREILAKIELGTTDGMECLDLRYYNEEEAASYYARLQANTLFGLKLESYLTSTEGDSESGDSYTLFSIHYLEIGGICIVYESQIDAIERNGGNSRFSILEIKKENNEKNARDAFKKYQSISKEAEQETRGKKQAIMVKLTLIKEIERDYSRFYKHFLQGELGNVRKYICGFTTIDKIGIKGESFDNEPKRSFSKELRHLNNFAALIWKVRVDRNCENFMYWKILKQGNYLRIDKIVKDGDNTQLAEMKI